MFSRNAGQRKKDEPTSLPVPTVPERPVGREIVIGFCLVSLFFIIGWSLLANVVNHRAAPELQRGLTALAKGQITEAQQFFESILKQNPNDPVTYLAIMAECQRSKQWKLLVLYGERGITACRYESDDVRAELYRHLTFGYLEDKSTQEVRREQKIAQALLYAKRAWELDRRNPEMMNHYGYLLADKGGSTAAYLLAERRLLEALDLIRAQEERPETTLLQAMIEDSYGWTLYRQGRYSEAIASLSDALHHLPSSSETGGSLQEIYYHLGAAYRQAGRPEEARKMLDIALYYDPNYAEAKTEREMLAMPPDSFPTALLPGLTFNPDALMQPIQRLPSRGKNGDQTQ